MKIKLAFLLCLLALQSRTFSLNNLPEIRNQKTIVDSFGLIHVKGNRIVDKNDNTVALHGMSLFWSQWGGKYYNENCIKWLRDEWKCTIIRAACGIEMGGYLANPGTEMEKVTAAIDAAVKLGIYVIVDWHDHKAQDHLQQSKEFFKTIALKYGDKPNLIYELYNEPLNVSWSNVIKPYAEEIIKVIRQYDPDNMIIVGNPNWSQDVDTAALDPIKDNNVAYSFHFYTSTHKQPLRNKAVAALNRGIPLFVTEFGISEASGDGIIDYAETEQWLKFVEEYKLSTCNWSVTDRDETSAALKPGSSPAGNWKETDLTESGIYIRNRLLKINSEIFKTMNY